MYGDVIDEESLVGDPQHDHARHASVPFSHYDNVAADHLLVIGGHRPRGHPDTRDIVTVRDVYERGHRGGVGRYGLPHQVIRHTRSGPCPWRVSPPTLA